MRGGIAERGGIRVGHRIIEINGQSVVATPHEKIIQILSSAVGEVFHFKQYCTIYTTTRMIKKLLEIRMIIQISTHSKSSVLNWISNQTWMFQKPKSKMFTGIAFF